MKKIDPKERIIGIGYILFWCYINPYIGDFLSVIDHQTNKHTSILLCKLLGQSNSLQEERLQNSRRARQLLSIKHTPPPSVCIYMHVLGKHHNTTTLNSPLSDAKLPPQKGCSMCQQRNNSLGLIWLSCAHPDHHLQRDDDITNDHVQTVYRFNWAHNRLECRWFSSLSTLPVSISEAEASPHTIPPSNEGFSKIKLSQVSTHLFE